MVRSHLMCSLKVGIRHIVYGTWSTRQSNLGGLSIRQFTSSATRRTKVVMIMRFTRIQERLVMRLQVQMIHMHKSRSYSTSDCPWGKGQRACFENYALHRISAFERLAMANLVSSLYRPTKITKVIPNARTLHNSIFRYAHIIILVQ